MEGRQLVGFLVGLFIGLFSGYLLGQAPIKHLTLAAQNCCRELELLRLIFIAATITLSLIHI